MRAKLCAAVAVPSLLGLMLTGAATGTAHAATTTYYVSPYGSDSNSGTSPDQAWKSAAKVNAVTFPQGSTVAFQGGEWFSGCLVFNSTNVPASSATTPFKVTSYGTGKATLRSTCTGEYSAAVTADHVSGFQLSGLKLVNGATTAAGVLLQNQSSTTATKSLLVSDSDISGFATPSGSTSTFGGQIMVLGYAVNGNTGPLDDVQIRNNILHGSSATSTAGPGVYGWGGGVNITNVRVEGNTVYNLGMAPQTTGAAITANGWNGAVIQRNVVHDIGANVTSCGGTSGIMTYTSNNVAVRHNEVYNVRPLPGLTAGCDWDGIDLDGGTTNSVVEYNYTHDNAGSGYLAYTSTAAGRVWGPNTFRYNISENDDAAKAQGGLFDVVPVAPKNALSIYGNTLYTGTAQTTKDTSSACFHFGYAAGTWGAGSQIKNNVCHMANKDKYGRTGQLYYNPNGHTGMTLANNLYYGAGTAGFRWGGTTYADFAAWKAAGHASGEVWGDPLFTAPGGGGTCTWSPVTGTGPQPCPSAYTLKTGSPAIGAGAAVTGNGGRDYYGTAIPVSPNIGADAG
ncbi:right-handed parallel beta-helix repeat-containing protein [Streptomyces sp. YC504]|uniref:Right-handed parallel beta-helix repeat-containing protein n=1 Tax=Streptomyces mesophilus TaxID=1775132 RepID=A0A6G4XFN4_9ACTN|nr:right-handed parallel beta-helix repeat-containing protein [Streptomyces mesophilus]NGO75534.1 right-handed parallel beta-helix repeat-containing protein [Streptomyces mesophilus]